MPIDFDTDIRDALFIGTVDAEEPYASAITDFPAKTTGLPEQRILALIATMHGYMTELLSREEARLAHYTMSRMLTKYGSGGFVYDDLSITETGNVSNPLFDPADTFVFQEVDGSAIDTIAVGGTGLLSDAVSAINAGGDFTARAVNGKLEITRAETPAVAAAWDITMPAAAEFAAAGDGEFWLIDSVNTAYYVWYDVDDGNDDPAVAGRVGIEVDVASGNTDTEVALATATAIDAIADFSASDDGADVEVVWADAGEVPDPTDGTPIGGAFATAEVTAGADRIGAAGWQFDISGVAARKAGFQTEEVFQNDADRVAAEARQEAVDIFLKEARGNRLI